MSDENQRQEQAKSRRRTIKEHGPDPIDCYVGNQLRIARELNRLTQSGVAQVLGMSFQVVQKYEQGEIRISASRLFQLARLLQRSVDYFFSGHNATSEPDLQLQRHEIELLRAYRSIIDPGLRQSILRLAADLCSAASAAGSDPAPSP